MGMKIFGSFGVSDRVVLPAVDLDHKALLMTREIREIGADGGLAPKMRVPDRHLSQVPPQLLLSVGHCAPHGTRVRNAPVVPLQAIPNHAPPPPTPPRCASRGGGELNRRGSPHITAPATNPGPTPRPCRWSGSQLRCAWCRPPRRPRIRADPCRPVPARDWRARS